MGTGECRRTVLLQPIYDALGPTKAAALINWHALTGCDTTGHIRGKGKQTCFKAFMTSPPDVVSSLQMLGEGDSPAEEVLDGCEAFLCSLYCPKGVKLSRASSLRWHLFKMVKPEQGWTNYHQPKGPGSSTFCVPTYRPISGPRISRKNLSLPTLSLWAGRKRVAGCCLYYQTVFWNWLSAPVVPPSHQH